MPILHKYNKPPMFQVGGKQSHIYKSAKELAKDAKFKNIRLHAKSGVTRCLGSALDAGKVCGYDYRPVLHKAFKTAPRVLGDTDNVVDAWDMKNASNNTDDISIIYDREKDGPITEEILNNLPLYAFIGTGDARGKYISKKNKKRISRHGIINTGFTESGKPIIYDLGKFSEGVPKKYLNEINYIAVPTANQIYFDKDYLNKVSAAETSLPEIAVLKPDLPIESKKTKKVKKKRPIVMNTVEIDNSYRDDFLALIKATYGG